MFEKKHGKRFLASVMALVMLLSLAPLGTLAADDAEKTQTNAAVTLPANEADQKLVVTDETTTVNTNEETTPPPANEGITTLPANNDNAPVEVEEESPAKESVTTHSSSSKWNQSPGNVYIKNDTVENCVVYYNDSKSSDADGLTQFNENDIIDLSFTGQYGIVFFVKPNDAYALTKITATVTNGRDTDAKFFSIVNNNDIESTAFYTEPASGNSGPSPAQNLQSAGFSNNEIKTLIQNAKNEGCVAAFIYTRTNGGNISTTLKFYAKSLATLEKKIVKVTSGEKEYDTASDIATAKVHAGDEITYEFSVTYTLEDGLTYDNIKVTDNRLENPEIKFNGPTNQSGTTYTEKRTATYIVKTADIANEQLVNTATLEYTYNAPFSVSGNRQVKAEASATIATVASVSYQYVGKEQPANAPAVTEPKEYDVGTEVTVADNPTVEGYTFSGWTTTDDITVKDRKFTMPNKHVVFSGSWTPITYTVTFNSNGGSEVKSQTVQYGEKAISQITTKDNYTFDGWYSDSSLKNKYNFDAIVTNDITLYAKWVEDSTTPTEPEKPEVETVDAMYFVLMPGQGVPNSGVNQGVDKYFPNASNNGGVEGRNNTNGYAGKITKAATELTGANTTDGYFNVQGVGNQYLKDIGNLGYFDARNYTNNVYNGTLPEGLSGFNMQNKEIVWYVIKKEGNDYHVDGYVKGVRIELKYFDEFDGQQIGKTVSLLSGNSVTIKNLPTSVQHNGWTFAGWFTKDGTKYEANSTHTLIDSLTLYARWTKDYDVVTHFMDANGDQKAERTNSNLSGVHGTLLKDMVLPLDQVDMNGITGNYVYVPSETKYYVNAEDKGLVGNATFTEANTVIHQYYYLDETGKTGEGEDGEPTEEKDGIPDAWQYKVIFQVKNGKWDNENSADVVAYVTNKDKDGNPCAKGTEGSEATLADVTIPTAGTQPDNGYKAGKWDNKPTETTKIITNNTTFTYTYDKEETEQPESQHRYTINRHLMNKDGDEVDISDKVLKNDSAKENTILNTLITDEMTEKQTNAGKDYVYVSSKTTYTVDKVTKFLATDSKLTGITTIDLYFYLDEIGGKDENGKPIDEGDNIPDCYQVTINYVDDNTGRGKITGLTKEVKTIKDAQGNPINKGTVKASGSTAEATGSRNYFSNWTNKDNTQVGTSATLGEQSFEAVGGETYTFTANFYHRSSSGGSRPSTPVVDIPDDDVPTGLNGADHYAYIIGYGNNDVRPQNNITRAEVATIFFRLLTDDTREANMTKNQNYSDVKDSNWFCRPVATLSAMNIIKGYTDGSFQPNGNITRAEFAAIAARFDPNGDTTPATFTDVAGHWAEKEISIAANHGWINGYEDGSFRPNQYITRAEAMTLINRVLNRLPETKDDLHADMKTWVDNMDETAWYYLAVQEATNSHYNENKEGTKFEKWTDMREARDWSELEK